jgi:hypothetical protein
MVHDGIDKYRKKQKVIDISVQNGNNTIGSVSGIYDKKDSEGYGYDFIKNN